MMPQTGVGLSAYRTTEQKAEAASVFLHWFTESQRNLEFVVDTGYMPVNKGSFEAIDSYPFPSESHRELYGAIKTMWESYTPVTRTAHNGFMDEADALCEGLAADAALPAPTGQAGRKHGCFGRGNLETVLFCPVRGRNRMRLFSNRSSPAGLCGGGYLD